MPSVSLPSLDSRDVLNTLFEQLAAYEELSWAKQIATVVPSDRGIEEYVALGSGSGFREWIGDRQADALKDYSYTLRNKLFERTIEVNVLDKRRDKTGQVAIRLGEEAEQAAWHWEELLTTLIEATATAGLDGATFFGATHPIGVETDGGTNDVAVGEVPSLNTASATLPTAAELEDIIPDLLAWQFRYRNDRGKPNNQGGRQFVFMHPVSWGKGPAVVLGSDFVTASVSNKMKAALASYGATVMPLANPRLTSAAKCYLFRVDSPLLPFIGQSEIDNEATALAEGSEHEHKTYKHQYGLVASRNVGYGRWQSATRATIS